jgi:hypothetical protein
MLSKLTRVRVFIKDGASIEQIETITSEIIKKGVKVEKSFETIGIIVCKVKQEQIDMMNSLSFVEKIEVED